MQHINSVWFRVHYALPENAICFLYILFLFTWYFNHQSSRNIFYVQSVCLSTKWINIYIWNGHERKCCLFEQTVRQVDTQSPFLCFIFVFLFRSILIVSAVRFLGEMTHFVLNFVFFFFCWIKVKCQKSRRKKKTTKNLICLFFYTKQKPIYRFLPSSNHSNSNIPFSS